MSNEKTYLWKNQLGIYTFRRRVPEELRSIIKKDVIQISLRTRDLTEATNRCEVQSMDCDKLFASAKRNLDRRGSKLNKTSKYGAVVPKIANTTQVKRSSTLPEMKMSISIPTQFGNILFNTEINAPSAGEDLEHYNQTLKSTLTTMMQNAAISAQQNLIQSGHLSQLPAQQASYEAYPSNITRSKNRATLTEFAEIFFQDRESSGRWSNPKNKGQYVGCINIFERIFGNKEIDLYTDSDALKFLSCVRTMPAGWLKANDTKDLLFEDAIKLNKQRLTRDTANVHITRIKTFFTRAKKLRYTVDNIFEAVDINTAEKTARKAFTEAELKLLFNKENFASFQKTGYPSRYPRLSASPACNCCQ